MLAQAWAPQGPAWLARHPETPVYDMWPKEEEEDDDDDDEEEEEDDDDDEEEETKMEEGDR